MSRSKLSWVTALALLASLALLEPIGCGSTEVLDARESTGSTGSSSDHDTSGTTGGTSGGSGTTGVSYSQCVQPGAPSQISDIGLPTAPTDVAMDADNVYWIIPQANLGVFKEPLSRSWVTVLATLPIGTSPNSYVTLTGSQLVIDSYEGLEVVSTAGGPLTTLVPSPEEIGPVASDGTTLYWANHNGGSIQSIPATGGTITTLATGENSPQSLIVDSTSLYWATDNATVIRSMPKSGGTPSTWATVPSGTFVQQLLSDDHNIYWIQNGNSVGAPAAPGQVMAMPKNATTPSTLATEVNHPIANFTADALCVYWEDDNHDFNSVSKSGGTPTRLAAMYNPNLFPSLLLRVDDSGLSWLEPGYGIYKLSR
jgi:hypothetical protein